jgi:hypothetical protein
VHLNWDSSILENDTGYAFSPENGGSMFFWIIGIYLQVHMALQLRRPTLTSSLLWEPQISYSKDMQGLRPCSRESPAWASNGHSVKKFTVFYGTLKVNYHVRRMDMLWVIWWRCINSVAPCMYSVTHSAHFERKGHKRSKYFETYYCRNGTDVVKSNSFVRLQKFCVNILTKICYSFCNKIKVNM